MLLALYSVCLIVGILVGLAGVGGILIPPALILLSGLDAHTAMGTALTSLLALGVVGTWTYHHMGCIPWRSAVPYFLGGLAAWPGALLNAHIPAGPLVVLLACLILFASFCALRPPRQGGGHGRQSIFWVSPWGIFSIGTVTGILAGLTGAGGPVLSIPWLITVGIQPMTAVGMSMPYQIVTSVAGTLGNIQGGHVDFSLLPSLCGLEIAGFAGGVILARRITTAMLGRVIGLLCFALGLFLLIRQLC